MRNNIHFTDWQLELAWEWFYYEVSKNPKYVSLIENLWEDEYLICFTPPKNMLRINPLKIHGRI